MAKRVDPKGESPAPDAAISAREQKLARAKFLLAQNLFDDALGEFTSILLTDPKNVEALLGRGSAFLGKEDWDAAVGDFNKLIELNPHSAEAYCLRAHAYLSQGDYYHARLDATDAIRLKPDYRLAYFYRADAYCQERNFEFAIASLREAVRLDRKLTRRDLQFEKFQARDLYTEIYQSQGAPMLNGGNGRRPSRAWKPSGSWTSFNR